EVFTGVVTHEWQHGHRVVAQGAHLGLGGGCGLTGCQEGADHGAVLPVVGLGDQRNGVGTTSTEEDRVDLDALPVGELGSRGRALLDGHAVAGVRVCGGLVGPGSPVVALPVNEVLRSVAIHALPPDVAVVGECDVGDRKSVV